MSTNTTIVSNLIEPIKIFPPNLRSQPLNIIFSDLLERGLQKFYVDQVESVSNLYNPENPYYDPEYILQFLGAAELADLISEDIDIKSISMIYPDLIKQKGRPEAVDTLLKLLKINYERYQLLRDRDGCVWLTIIIKDGHVVETEDLIKFEKLSRKFLPICVRLRSITSCSDVKYQAFEADSDWDFDISAHELDNNLRLDFSREDRNQGMPISNSNLVIKLCNKESHYVEMTYNVIAEMSRTQSYNHYVDCQANYALAMDRDLQADIDNSMSVRSASLVER